MDSMDVDIDIEPPAPDIDIGLPDTDLNFDEPVDLAVSGRNALPH